MFSLHVNGWELHNSSEEQNPREAWEAYEPGAFTM